MTTRAAIGRTGEDLASRYLTSLGWTVIERNWRCRAGEIDLVARDGRHAVIVEVKTRSSVAFGTPVDAITFVKLARLRRLALAWQAERGIRAPLRIDIIGILMRPDAKPEIDHVRGVG